jgi:hypothetical protein
MADDHLDKETSVGVDITATGINAKAKSRLIAAIDRFGGNLAELLNVPIERKVNRERAIMEGETKMIAAVVDYGVDRLKHDPGFAQRVAEGHFGRLFARQKNKDGVLLEAIEDLRRGPSTAASEAGEPELDPQFLDRLERYAEDASTDDLKQRWGRVLSAEIRKPGTFSSKVLRIVDEIDARTALIFERVCQSRISDILPKCVLGELRFDEGVALSLAGLLVDPTAGQLRYPGSITVNDETFWIFYLGKYGFAFSQRLPMKTEGAFSALDSNQSLIRGIEGKPSMPIYLLTEAGVAISQILPNYEDAVFPKLSEKLKSLLRSTDNVVVEPHEIVELEINPADGHYHPREMKSSDS